VAILIPSATSARIAARRVKTKVQFSQWAAAMEQFRQEYGYYPAIDGGSGNRVAPDYFAGALTGQTLDGQSAASGSQLAGNARLLRFYNIGEGELNASRTALTDAFGNTDIAVIYDRNGDGLVNSADGAVVGVRGLASDGELLPASGDLDLTAGVRAGVIFYSAGNGTAQGDLVFSWK
jgi:general secretion pathway protein G